MRHATGAWLLISMFLSAGQSKADSINEEGLPSQIWTEIQKITASDAAEFDRFGNDDAVAISGDTIVVGAPFSENGSVYVFERDQGWGEVTKLIASDAAEGDSFGKSVAISGNTIVVGAGASDATGWAYVFERAPGGTDDWDEVTKLTASDAAGGDGFGRSVAISDDTILIGAGGNDDAGSASGSAYVFERDQDWGEIIKILASDAATDDHFGDAVAISGNTIVIGAEANDDAGSNSGSAYVFERDQGEIDNWVEVTKLTASDAAETDRFGNAVAISENTIVVGSRLDDAQLQQDGSAYVFERNQGWGEVTKLTAFDAESGSWFGYSASISGDTIVIGAGEGIGGGHSHFGSAYVFERDLDGADTWGVAQKLTASDAATDDGFGYAASISGDTIVIGAPRDDDAGSGSGSAYVFQASEPAESACDSGIVHDDGFAEGGYGQLSAGGYVQEFTISGGLGAVLTDVCISWSRNGSDADLPHNIVVYDDDGPNGGPGTQLLSFPTNATGVPASFDPAVFFTTSVDGTLPVLSEGTYYIGALWNGAADELFFISYDNSETTTYVPSYDSQDNGGTWTQLPEGILQAFLIRVKFAAVAGPVPPPGDNRGNGVLLQDRPTIVLTHGLQDDDTLETELWTAFETPQQAGSLIQAALPDVNVIQWVWDGAFQPLFLGLPTGEDYINAQQNVAQAALALANFLKADLDESYDLPIQFIGHSLGVPVSAFAAALFLNDRPLVTQAQVTALDRPDKIRKIIGILPEDEPVYGYGRAFLHRTLFNFTRPVNPPLRIDNYYSTTGIGVGDVAQGSVYNHGDLIDSGDLDALVFMDAFGDHSGVQQWYRWSIDPVGLLSDPDPPDPVPCLGGTFNPTFIEEHNLDESLSPCEKGWYWSVVLNGTGDIFPADNGSSVSGTGINPVDLQNFLDFGCTVAPSGITCSERVSRSEVITGIEPLAAGAQLDVPSGTQFMTFEYRFSAAGPDDYAAVFLDGVALWEVTATVAGASPDFVAVIPIPVGNLGGNYLMSVVLYGSGSPDTVFEVRNIEFLVELPLFADGFESGDTSAWSPQTP